MRHNPESGRPDATIQLPARLDIAAAGRLRDWYLGLSCDAVLDASAVDVVTTPALQVMMAGRDWLRDRGFGVRIDGPTSDFLASLTVLGTSLARLSHHRTDMGRAL